MKQNQLSSLSLSLSLSLSRRFLPRCIEGGERERHTSTTGSCRHLKKHFLTGNPSLPNISANSSLLTVILDVKPVWRASSLWLSFPRSLCLFLRSFQPPARWGTKPWNMFHINEVRHHTHLQGTWYFKFRWPPNSCVKESCFSKGLSSLVGSVVHPVWIAFLGFGGLCHVEVPICCSVFELCVCEREREL